MGRTARGFQRTYRSDFAAFVNDCIDFKDDEGPTKYQNEILERFTSERKLAVRGPHGLGKTTLAAWILLAFCLTRDGEDWKVPTTASTARQLTKFLWPEIHKWAAKVKWEKVGRKPWTRDELLDQNIKIRHDGKIKGEAFAAAVSDAALIEGAHADQLLFIFDEAKAISEDIWNAAEGAFASGECYALAISTPGDMSGRFYEIHTKKPGLTSWWTKHVTLEESIDAGRISKAWAEEKKEQWGEDSPIYQARVLGEFPEQGEDQLISLGWIEKARFNEMELGDEEDSALDVARFGSDDSVWGKRSGGVLLQIETRHGNRTTEIAGLVKSLGVHCKVDAIGIGAGVVDILYEADFEHTEVNVAEKSSEPDRFKNLRAEIFWNLRERFKDGRIDLTRINQRDYDRTSYELTNIKYKYNTAGQIVLEPKEDMKKRLGKSPDMADMMAMLYGIGKKVVYDAEITTKPFVERRGRVFG